MSLDYERIMINQVDKKRTSMNERDSEILKFQRRCEIASIECLLEMSCEFINEALDLIEKKHQINI